MTTPIAYVYVLSKSRIHIQNGIFQIEWLTITTPGSVVHIYLPIYALYSFLTCELLHCAINNGMNGLHSLLATNFEISGHCHFNTM